jgi:hypothetical protein
MIDKELIRYREDWDNLARKVERAKIEALN